MTKYFTLTLLSLLFLLTSCGNPVDPVSAGGTPQNPVYGQYNSNELRANDFINALNAVDGEHSYRVITPNDIEHNYIVIWDAQKNEYMAIDLFYLRSIVYYDYYANNTAVANEYRRAEQAAPYNGSGGYSPDFEVVDNYYTYDFETNRFEDSYVGRQSGYMYEDEMNVTDVSLMARETENDKFLRKAANVSIAFQVSIETSLSMVTLGSKIEKMLSRNNGELTADDTLALTSDMQSLTGVTLAEIKAAAADSSKKEEVLQKIAHKLGTSTQNLEEKLLPGVFGMTL